MKRTKNLLIAGLVFLCASTATQAQVFTEDLKKEFKLSGKSDQQVLALYNLTGFVKVEGYSGNEVVLEVKRKISGKTDELVEQGKREVKLEMEQHGDSVLVYLSGPYITKPGVDREERNGWRSIQYHYTHDFTIKVPHATRLRLSTVNNGNIDVKDVYGALRLNNVNGSIQVHNARAATEAKTINGKVEVSYAVNPATTSSYSTINGDITVKYKDGVNADLHFKSLHGKYYTDFENASLLSGSLSKNVEKKGEATVYKLNKDTGIRLGNGGNTFRFETLNGDIYIKKQ